MIEAIEVNAIPSFCVAEVIAAIEVIYAIEVNAIDAIDVIDANVAIDAIDVIEGALLCKGFGSFGTDRREPLWGMRAGVAANARRAFELDARRAGLGWPLLLFPSPWNLSAGQRPADRVAIAASGAPRRRASHGGGARRDRWWTRAPLTSPVRAWADMPRRRAAAIAPQARQGPVSRAECSHSTLLLRHSLRPTSSRRPLRPPRVSYPLPRTIEKLFELRKTGLGLSALRGGRSHAQLGRACMRAHLHARPAMHACGRLPALGAPRTGALGCRRRQLRGWVGHDRAIRRSGDRAIGGTVASPQEGGRPHGG